VEQERMYPRMTEKDLILTAAKILKKGWCQGAAAKTSDGTSCYKYDALAAQWTLPAALDKARREMAGDESIDVEASYETRKWAGYLCKMAIYNAGTNLDMAHPFALTNWNNQPGRKLAQVLGILQAAIVLWYGEKEKNKK